MKCIRHPDREATYTDSKPDHTAPGLHPNECGYKTVGLCDECAERRKSLVGNTARMVRIGPLPMKARDIIPGWPRSRSTSSLTAGENRVENLENEIAWLKLRMQTPMMHRRVSDYHLAMLRSELMQESAYHSMQQFRQNAWFERWRSPTWLALNVVIHNALVSEWENDRVLNLYSYSKGGK